MRGRRAIVALRGWFAATVAVVAVPGLNACRDQVEPEELLGEPHCRELRLVDVPRDSNVIIFLNDTMRRDVMGAYGGAAATPHFDHFAEQNLLFQQVTTQSPWTKPSIATLFTSLFPSQHGVESNSVLRKARNMVSAGKVIEADVLADSLETLAEVLADSGFRTAAFLSNPWMAKSFGFGQGFEIYDDSYAGWGATGEDVIAAALAWIDSLEPDERYFLYLHTIDTHQPYVGLLAKDLPALRARYNKEPMIDNPQAFRAIRWIVFDDGRTAHDLNLRPTRGLIAAAYRAGVENFDDLLGDFLARVAETQGIDRTAIIVTSDHGASLFQRGYGSHGASLYGDEIAIPFAARLPGVAPAQGQVDCLVGLIDVMPSLCDYTGASCGESVQGWSFFSSPDSVEDTERRYLVSEGVMYSPQNRSIRNRRFKLIYEPVDRSGKPSKEDAWSLFDLQADANEEIDHLSKRHRSKLGEIVFEALRDEVAPAVAELQLPEPKKREMSAELKARLEALGYAK